MSGKKSALTVPKTGDCAIQVLAFTIFVVFSGNGDWMTLNQVRFPLVNQTTCNQPTWYNNSITERMLCAGYEQGGKDTCSV